MSQNQVKYLATLLMIIDHIGLLLEINELKIMGVLSFPLFCWVLARNWERKNDKKVNNINDNSVKKLLMFGIISQIPYKLCTNRIELNLLVSFLICILTFKEVHKTDKKLITLLVGMVASELMNVSYGWFAIICPLLMINFKGQSTKKEWWFSWISANVLYTVTCQSFIQIVAIITPLIVMYHNPATDKKPGTIEKNFFYYFYPIHLVSLASIKGIL